MSLLCLQGLAFKAVENYQMRTKKPSVGRGVYDLRKLCIGEEKGWTFVRRGSSLAQEREGKLS